MAQSPIDMGQGAGVGPPQDRYSGATIVMNARPGESVSNPAAVPLPGPLSETIPAVRPIAASLRETDEPSIEEYMAALLARTRQFSTSPPVRAEQPGTPPSAERPTPSARATVSPALAPAGPTPTSECRTAISELRELANISAQSSFHAHRAQYLMREMQNKRFVAIIAMIASVMLLSFASTVQSPAYITAVAAVAAACAFSVKYLALGRELSRLCVGANVHDRSGR